MYLVYHSEMSSVDSVSVTVGISSIIVMHFWQSLLSRLIWLRCLMRDFKCLWECTNYAYKDVVEHKSSPHPRC